jgi:DNA-binding MarR family transcriptional regulator
MQTIDPALTFFINMAKANAIAARRFDAHLGTHHGLGLNEFIILLHLGQASGGKLNRTELAQKIGLTASGVTRLLAPMEKLGFIKREAAEHDARISYVAIAPGGKRLLDDALDTAEETGRDLIPAGKEKKAAELSELLGVIASAGQIY